MKRLFILLFLATLMVTSILANRLKVVPNREENHYYIMELIDGWSTDTIVGGKKAMRNNEVWIVVDSVIVSDISELNDRFDDFEGDAYDLILVAYGSPINEPKKEYVVIATRTKEIVDYVWAGFVRHKTDIVASRRDGYIYIRSIDGEITTRPITSWFFLGAWLASMVLLLLSFKYEKIKKDILAFVYGILSAFLVVGIYTVFNLNLDLGPVVSTLSWCTWVLLMSLLFSVKSKIAKITNIVILSIFFILFVIALF